VAENQKPLQAEYVRKEGLVICGEPMAVRIRYNSTGKTEKMTAEQLSEKIQKGLIEVKGIGLRPDGTIKITHRDRRKTKRKPNKYRKKLLELYREKDKLEKNPIGENCAKIQKISKTLVKLIEQPEYYKEDEKIFQERYSVKKERHQSKKSEL
jgi:hypothetical protein